MTRRMGQNLDSSRGLIVGEAVMMGIAPFVGRNAAHEIVYESCKECIEDGGSTLYDHLVKRSDITDKISAEQLRSLCEPRNYLGAAQRMVDDVIARDPARHQKSCEANSAHSKVDGEALVAGDVPTRGEVNGYIASSV